MESDLARPLSVGTQFPSDTNFLLNPFEKDRILIVFHLEFKSPTPPRHICSNDPLQSLFVFDICLCRF